MSIEEKDQQPIEAFEDFLKFTTDHSKEVDGIMILSLDWDTYKEYHKKLEYLIQLENELKEMGEKENFI